MIRPQLDESTASSLFHGAFGACIAYDDVVCMRMFPLHRLVKWTLDLDSFQTAAKQPVVIFVANLMMNRAVVVATSDATPLMAAPGSKSCVPAAPPDARPGDHDGVLRCVPQPDQGVHGRTVTLARLLIPNKLAIPRLEFDIHA